jgi:dTDP-glucose pyrophosphorylase
MDYNNLINQNKTILESLKKLGSIRNLSRLILFVTNNKNQVVGSITDGDIRRSLIKDNDLYKKIGEICNNDFIYITNTDIYIDFKNEYLSKNIKILPVLNKARRLVDVIDLEKAESNLPLECVIMAGGRGKRLSPLTDKIPKPMLMLGSKPIIEHNIDRLIKFGIKKIYISVNYLSSIIKDYFGDGSNKGIEIQYIEESKPLGTAGSLTLVEKFKTNHVLLMNSDLFTNIDFEKMYKSAVEKKSSITLASKDYKVDIPYAIFESNNSIISKFKEKPVYNYSLNAGIYILKKEVINKIPKDTFYDITDLIEKLMQKNEIVSHTVISGYWIDIGKKEDYTKAQELILKY